jgi:hypothetical protein
LLFAIAALVYQEVSWRDKARRIQADYEKRISTEVAMAYETSLADDETPVRALTFQAEKQEPRGLFHEVTRHLFIAIAMNGDAVKYAAGDLNEIERFAFRRRSSGRCGSLWRRAGDGGGGGALFDVYPTTKIILGKGPARRRPERPRSAVPIHTSIPIS